MIERRRVKRGRDGRFQLRLPDAERTMDPDALAKTSGQTRE